MDETRLDGNAAAGMLAEIFTVDMTVAITACAGCGSSHPVGALDAHLKAPGLVLRCSSCGIVQLRMVRAPDLAWLDLNGAHSLRIEIPSDPDGELQIV